jgi:hypothetical protein
MCCCGDKGHHDCSCGCGGHSHKGGHQGCSCGCGGHSGFGPALWTRDEKVAWLQERLDGLREQAKAVEERIAALKAE